MVGGEMFTSVYVAECRWNGEWLISMTYRILMTRITFMRLSNNKRYLLMILSELPKLARELFPILNWAIILILNQTEIIFDYTFINIHVYDIRLRVSQLGVMKINIFNITKYFLRNQKIGKIHTSGPKQFLRLTMRFFKDHTRRVLLKESLCKISSSYVFFFLFEIQRTVSEWEVFKFTVNWVLFQGAPRTTILS